METKQQTPSQGPKPPAFTPLDDGRAPAGWPRQPLTAESTRAGVTVRVAVVNERHDEEEMEAGYGHGV